MTYWLNLFTGTTWDEFRKSGARITGFRPKMEGNASKVKKGDIFVCYLTGVMRWIGALEVIRPSKDKSRIWQDELFPVRFEVKPLVILEPEHGVPMQHLYGKVSFFTGPEDEGKFKGFVRMSPNRFRNDKDAELIIELINQAETRPVSRPVDPRKLARKPLYRAERRKGKTTLHVEVSVPDSEDRLFDEIIPPMSEEIPTLTEKGNTTRHTEIQYYLLTLGSDMGLDVWVARNDKSREWNGVTLGTISNIINELPTQFNEATNKTIELIDVLWLRGNSIVAAFEVESTTSIYSGLLRMSDLLALQPNLDIKLYLVAPDERRNKVEQEILRPTFSLRERPLPEACGFIPFSKLIETVEGIRKLGLASSLKPDFLQKTAEFFNGDSKA